MPLSSSRYYSSFFRLAIPILCALSMLLSAQSAHAITLETGANADATTIPIPACSTFGFSVETTVTLPTGFNTVRMLRVDQSGNNPFGYALTETATGYSVYVFDLRTMAEIGRTTRVITGYAAKGRLQGEIGSDGKLYVFNEVSNVNPSCPASDCLMMSRFMSNSLELSVVDATSAAISNIDDARESNNNFLTLTAPSAGNRTFKTYSKSGLTLQATGTVESTSNFGDISRSINGRLYSRLVANATTTTRTFPVDGASSDGTTVVTFSGTKMLRAIYPIVSSSLNLVAFDSDISGGVAPERSWIDASSLTASGPTAYSGGVADLDGSFQAGFYDVTNNKVFSMRDSAGIGVFLRTTPGVSGFTTEQNFAGCGAPCTNIGGTSTGSQIVDYSPQRARLYIGSSETPARISKIKVCATGGPAQ